MPIAIATPLKLDEDKLGFLVEILLIYSTDPVKSVSQYNQNKKNMYIYILFKHSKILK